MFGLFSSPSFSDPDLGELKRSRGMWRGQISSLGGATVPLVVSGSRSEPDSVALDSTKAIPGQYAEWQATIEKELFEHFAPYAEAVAEGESEAPEEPLPEIHKPGDVWPHVSLEFVAVTLLKGKTNVELGYRVAWDEEHTLGALFQNDQFIELCGSVLHP
jgi:hypothetical protein